MAGNQVDCVGEALASLQVADGKAPENPHYEVKAIPGKGYGCFALRAMKRGTRILAEKPLFVIPNADYLHEDIQKVFDELTAEEQSLYFTLASAHGQDPRMWPHKIHSRVSGRERQRIQEQHQARTSKEPSLVSIFQTNCMEWNDGAAIFPYAARFNHSCNPNACFYWNSKIGKETIHLMHDVKKGEELTLSYCDMTHDKRLRAWELRHYGFECDCPACDEDDSDENAFTNKTRERRYRLTELDSELLPFRGHNLSEGAKQNRVVRKLMEMIGLHREEGEFSARLAAAYFDLALICELRGALQNAKQIAVLAVGIKKDCQGEDAPDYEEYVGVVRRIEMKLAHL